MALDLQEHQVAYLESEAVKTRNAIFRDFVLNQKTQLQKSSKYFPCIIKSKKYKFIYIIIRLYLAAFQTKGIKRIK